MLNFNFSALITARQFGFSAFLLQLKNNKQIASVKKKFEFIAEKN
jgi:hypothetical protein